MPARLAPAIPAGNHPEGAGDIGIARALGPRRTNDSLAGGAW